MRWKNAVKIEFLEGKVKDDFGNEEDGYTETIPEMIEKALKFAYWIKDEELEYHKEDAEYNGRYPHCQLTKADMKGLKKYYDETFYILPKGKDRDGNQLEFLV